MSPFLEMSQIGKAMPFWRSTLCVLYQSERAGGDEVKIYWCSSKIGKFTICSFYKSLSMNTTSSLSWKSIWKSKALINAIFFVWIASLGNILALDNITKLQIIVMEWCCMCKSSGEFVYYSLLYSEIAMALWNDFFARIGLTYRMARKVIDLLASCKGLRGNSRIIVIWKMVLLYLLWCLWSQRSIMKF